MKKNIIIAFILISFAMPAIAQRDGRPRPEKKRPEVTELVNDLSAVQKRKIENITNDSRQRMESLRAQQRAVRDSIGLYMDREGDQSKQLYPLFERDASLRVAISREMYSTKVAIDQVLNADQRRELKAALKSRKAKENKKK